MNDTLILLNRAAGGGRAGRAWPRLVEQFPQLKSAALIDAESAAATLLRAKELLQDQRIKRLLSIGGDGTAHLATNALLSSGRNKEVALGIVAAGTGSDFARHFGMPNKPRMALTALLDNPRPRLIDAIEITTDSETARYCLNVASAGLSGAVGESINAAPRQGDTSYLAAALEMLWRFEPKACRVRVDNSVFHEGPLFLLAIGNGSYFGKGMRVAPNAQVDDGLLEIIAIPPIPRWQLPIHLPKFLVGRHIHLPFVKARRGQEVSIEPVDDFPPYDLDGETMPAKAARFRILPKALSLLYS